VHYLKLGDGGSHAATLTRYTALLARGLAPDAAALDAFGDLAALERQLQGYVRRETFYDARLPVTAEREVSPITSHTLSAADAALVLGDFLTHTNKTAEAARLLDLAAQQQPALPEVRERMALLALQERDPARARVHADRALAFDAARPIARYLRAVALLASTEGLNDALVRQAEDDLRAAIHAAPELAPAYSLLGGLLAARDGRILEGLALVQRAISLDPSAVTHQVALGQILLLSGEAAEAQRVAESARAAARTASERETVERLLAAALRPGGMH
jgi:tetratricopeptide (TPR) repeat protein